MNRLACSVAVAITTAAAPAAADVVLIGNQHVGDNVITNEGLTPQDNVGRIEHFNFPSRFDLSSQTTVTAVRFDNLLSRSGLPRLAIDGTVRAGSFDTATDTFTLSTPVTLAAGLHTLAIDPGCVNANENPPVAFAVAACTNEDDIGWSSLTLISDASSTSINLNQRRHTGNFSGESDQYGGTYYPDPAEGEFIDYTITLERPRQTSTLTMYNIRHLDRLVVNLNGSVFGVYGDTDGIPNNASQRVITNAVALAVGTHALQIEAPGFDDVSWDDLILRFSDTSTTLPDHFNAVDPGQNGVTGPITTKIAGAAFSLDIHVLAANADPTGNFTGTLNLDLLDTRDNSGALDIYGCRSSWTTVASLGSVALSNQSSTTATGLSHSGALREARIRITDTALNLSTCSGDAFALRPATVDVVASDTTDSTPGTVRTLNNIASPVIANPVHRAGQPFTLTLTPRDTLGNAISGLDIDPDLTPTAIAPASSNGVIQPGTFANQGNLRISDSARYNEVGAFNLLADFTAFSAVDASDTPVATRTLTSTAAIGRFVPNQFAVSQNTPTFAPGCTNHSYLGQNFGFATTPQLTLTAQDAVGATTSNYTGGLFRLDNSSASTPAFTSDLGSLTVSSPTVLITDIGGGQALVAFNAGSLVLARGAPAVPIEPAIALTSSITDNDGVAALANPQQVGQSTPGNGIAFTGGNNSFRHGLLRMDNAYGSPLLDLQMPLTLRYWADLGGGQAGYTVDTQAACVPAIVTVGTITVDQTTLAGGNTTASGPAFNAATGTGSITLSQPDAGASGYVTVDLALPPGNAWLLDGANPTARGSFGLKAQPDQLIHYREVIR